MKFTHFISVKTSYSAKEYAYIYIRDIVKMHGMPISIISNRGTQVKLGMIFHLKNDGPAERTIYTS